MQIYCRDWRLPTISIFDMSTHSERSLYTLGPWFKNRQIHTLSKQHQQLRNSMVMSYFQRNRPDCKVESFDATGKQKNWVLQCWGVFSHCNTVFEALGWVYYFCPCQQVRPSLSEEDFQRGSKKRELDDLRRICQFTQEKGFSVIEVRECEWWRLYKGSKNFKNISDKNFLTDVHLQLTTS